MSKIPNKELLIFDWDGTIMDSVPKIVATLQSAARSLSVPEPDPISAKNIIGLSLDTAVATLFPEHSEFHQALEEQYKHHYLAVDTTPTPLFDDVASTLTALKNKGYALAVATGKSRKGLDRLLVETGLAHFFDITRTACEAQSKPHPEMLEHILAFYQLSPEQAVMIGDTQIDMQLAANAGVDSIGVTFGVHTKDELEIFSPKATVNSYRELLALF
ncbi:HAD-IA family hydrolase [Pseudoalteromonas sp. T1lg75]|uniref:HAD-IA family hydrolase n=1 Tax=Pseudoalteromonas sp. T1lg75 TaxID=2077102 RepID=UPI002D79552E|nr:HAD-IA family hydrolase [Pseudoalteromonas sp. T1lg75]